MTSVPKVTESGKINLHMPIMHLSQTQKHEAKMLKQGGSVEYWHSSWRSTIPRV